MAPAPPRISSDGRERLFAADRQLAPPAREQAHDLAVVPAHRVLERRAAKAVDRVGVGALGQEPLDDGEAPLGGRQVQGGAPVVVAHVPLADVDVEALAQAGAARDVGDAREEEELGDGRAARGAAAVDRGAAGAADALLVRVVVLVVFVFVFVGVGVVGGARVGGGRGGVEGARWRHDVKDTPT